jgi:hypothetical protein
MNCKKFIRKAVVCVTLLAGCTSKTGDSAGITTVDFHSYTEKPLSEMPDKFYSGKRYVALHADDQNLMIGRVGNVVIHGDRIFAGENFMGSGSRQNLVVHDSDGRAIAKIGNMGRGPGEYLQITDFDVDRQGRVHLYDGNFGAKKIYVFDETYKFVDEKQLPFSVDLMKCTPDGGYLFVRSTWDDAEWAGKRFVKTDADLNVVATAGEWDMSQIDNNVRLGDGSFVATPEGVFHQHAPDETLYRLDWEGNIENRWFFDFGGFNIPPQNRSDLGSLMESGMDPYRFMLDFVVPWERYIFGTMLDKGEVESFVYDTRAEVNYTLDMVASVDFGRFLTITDGRLITNFPYFDGETFPADLPADLRPAVTSGAPLLCLYDLK